MPNNFEEKSFIESNKKFQRLEETTQVLKPETGRTEVIKTRQSHSYEVATSSSMIVFNIAKKLKLNFNDIDYQQSVENVSLLHDIGHPPFGHDGATIINDFFINLGISEGFDDNNNNLVTLEKNKFNISDHVFASLIKYPNKLYSSQTAYLDLLQKELNYDALHFSLYGIILEKQTRTISCQIMDEADRNSYTCSDLADFFCLGGHATMDDLVSITSYNTLSDNIKLRVKKLHEIILEGNKSNIKSFFNNLKNEFNNILTINEKGIVFDNNEMFAFREYLAEVEYKLFISPIKEDITHLNNLEMLKDFINYVVENKYYPSKTYKKLIESTDCQKQKYIYIRDMVSEVSDWYIISFHKNLKQDNFKKNKITLSF